MQLLFPSPRSLIIYVWSIKWLNVNCTSILTGDLCMYGSSIAVCIEREKSQVTGNPLYGETGEREERHIQREILASTMHPQTSLIVCCTNDLTPSSQAPCFLSILVCRWEDIYSSVSRMLNFSSRGCSVSFLGCSKGRVDPPLINLINRLLTHD